MTCRNCSMEIPEGATKCPTCGAVILEIDQNHHRKEKARIVLILCIFLGMFGIHKFVEGEIGWGLLYLFTMGLFCIGWLIDIVRYSVSYYYEYCR